MEPGAPFACRSMDRSLGRRALRCFLPLLALLFHHSSSRRLISALGTATTVRKRLSIFWKGFQSGTSVRRDNGQVTDALRAQLTCLAIVSPLLLSAYLPQLV